VVSAIRHLARWLVWQVGDHDHESVYLAPASITVFSTGQRGDLPA
jgi:hypothetical protein